MENNRPITILAVTKTEGAGARSVAKKLELMYNYDRCSIREYLENLFLETYKAAPASQDQLEDFATEQRKEKGVETIISPIITGILEHRTHEFVVIESFLCPGEIVYLYKACRGKNVKIKLIGLDAEPQQRLVRLKNRASFKGEKTLIRLERAYIPPTTEIIQAQRWNEECDTNPERVNIWKCLQIVRQKGKLFKNADSKLDQTVCNVHQYVLK
jgi:hypothetical protein